jgi:hypothetical protein
MSSRRCGPPDRLPSPQAGVNRSGLAADAGRLSKRVARAAHPSGGSGADNQPSRKALTGRHVRPVDLYASDSTAPKPGPAQPTNTESDNLLRRVSALLPAVAHLGAGRLLAQVSYGSLPPRLRDEARANSSTAATSAATSRSFSRGPRRCSRRRP